MPFIVRPRGIWTTAAPRPIVAIVPLSWYANGSVSLPATRRAMFSPACSPACSATEPSCGSTSFVFVSVIARDVADGEHLGMPGEAEIGLDGDAVAPLQLEPERLDERVRLQAGAPDERVRRRARCPTSA